MAEESTFDRLQSLDKEARAWLRLTEQRLKRRLLSLSLGEKVALAIEIKRRANDPEGKLVNSVKGTARKRQGELEYLAFSFARKGIFLEHGVGKHRPKGSPFVRPKPWLQPTLEPAIEQLADILEQEYADIAAGELRLLIPGIIDIRIKT